MSLNKNILIIVTDQLRSDCVGYANKYPVKTPNIDKLAFKGVVFNHAYTNTPICCPARQSMLCGKRAERFGCNWNYDSALETGYLNSDMFTFSKSLKSAGYKTAYLGKWHVSPKETPTDFGYDKYIPNSEHHSYIRKKYPDKRYPGGISGLLAAENDFCELEDSSTHWFASQAMDVIDSFSLNESPWHMRLDFHEPHLPCRPAGEFAHMYPPESIPKWEGFGDDFKDKPYIQYQQLLNWGIEDYTWKDFKRIVSKYYGVITQTDDAIGRVVSHLEKKDMLKDTIVIFTSDHGDMCGSHRMMDKHYCMYDDIMRIPLIFYSEGDFPQGSTIDEFVYNSLDMAPTVLDMAGIRTEGVDFDGKSLLPLLTGRETQIGRDYVTGSFNGQQFGLYTTRMIRTEKYKYIFNATDIDEFYDMEKDPGELENLIADTNYLDRIRDLRNLLYEELKKYDDPMFRHEWFDNAFLKNKKHLR